MLSKHTPVDSNRLQCKHRRSSVGFDVAHHFQPAGTGSLGWQQAW